MNDNDIIKALEVIASADIGDCSRDCGFYDGKVHFCGGVVAKHSLDLITRQKAEIERLKKHNTEMARKHYSDGIKEFAEKLKEQFSTENHTDWVSNLYFPKWMAQIDNLVKEMTEETP